MRSKLCFLLILTMTLSLIVTNYGYSQTVSNSDVLIGTIKGHVNDDATKTPLIGTNIIIAGTQMGAATDLEGNFTLHNVPIGSYTLRFSYIGYEPLTKTDIIVKSNRITFVLSGLKMSAIESEEAIVTAGYFSQVQDQPTSAINFSSEEIRRAPGSAGDVSRIIMGLPSLAKVNDQMNSLIVRGGSPIENSFFIDNIEIPNINHYPTQGSSGGPIGIVNVDFIQDVNFYTGGFSAAYGDRLSSIMELTFREGNRDEFDGQLELNFAGSGIVMEGPILNKRGSVFFSARRSFLDLLIDAIGTGVAPQYSDYQSKLVYDISQNNKISVLNILGIDYIGFTRDDAEEMGNSVYGDTDVLENSFGVNWQSLWSKDGYSNTSVSHIAVDYKTDFTEIAKNTRLFKNESFEQIFQFRNVNYYRFNESNQIEFGFDAKHFINNFDYFYADYIDAIGNPVPELQVDNKIKAEKYGAFASYTWKPMERLTTTTGVRLDHFSFNENSHIAPRFSLSYRITDRTSLNGSTGIYYQNIPLVILSQNKKHKNLKDPVAYHYVIGLNHLLTENTRLTFELYDKEYDNFPLDPTTPSLFVLDELFYRFGLFFNHDDLVDTGKAYSRGVELTIQKKLAEDFYGLVGASYFRTRYRDYNDIWRDRVFDNQYTFSIEGGYKPNNKWEYSIRWIYAGGAPFTPFDLEASEAINRGVFNQNRINEARYADYHSLNIRFDRRFHYNKTNLIAYFSIWNAYNRKNIASYYWNEFENKQDTFNQWSLLPVFGLEYEF